MRISSIISAVKADAILLISHIPHCFIGQLESLAASQPGMLCRMEPDIRASRHTQKPYPPLPPQATDGGAGDTPLGNGGA